MEEPPGQSEQTVNGRSFCVSGSERYSQMVADPQGEIVQDALTCTEWQAAVSSTRMTWFEALAHCRDLFVGGKDDFRLPNVKELLSLVDDTRGLPSIDVVVFPDTPSEAFWSSSPSTVNKGFARIVNFDYGEVDASPLHDEDQPAWVRCVR